MLQQRGQLEAQLSTQTDLEGHIRHIEHEQQHLRHRLEQQQYGAELQAELKQLDHSLAQLAYDDRDHALARGQVDRLRWADIKHHELKQAQSRQRQLEAQQQSVNQTISDLEEQLEKLRQSPLQQQLQETLIALEQLHYDAHHHQQIRQALRQAQAWPPAAAGYRSGTTRLSPAQSSVRHPGGTIPAAAGRDCYPDSFHWRFRTSAAGHGVILSSPGSS